MIQLEVQTFWTIITIVLTTVLGLIGLHVSMVRNHGEQRHQEDERRHKENRDAREERKEEMNQIWSAITSTNDKLAQFKENMLRETATRADLRDMEIRLANSRTSQLQGMELRLMNALGVVVDHSSTGNND